MNIFKINKCKKNFFEKFPFFRGVALIKKFFFGQNFFAHVSGKNKTFVKKKFFFFLGATSLFKAKKAKMCQSPIFEISIFKGQYGPV